MAESDGHQFDQPDFDLNKYPVLSFSGSMSFENSGMDDTSNITPVFIEMEAPSATSADGGVPTSASTGCGTTALSSSCSHSNAISSACIGAGLKNTDGNDLNKDTTTG